MIVIKLPMKLPQPWFENTYASMVPLFLRVDCFGVTDEDMGSPPPIPTLRRICHIPRYTSELYGNISPVGLVMDIIVAKMMMTSSLPSIKGGQR